MRIYSVCVLGWTIFHQLLLARAQTPPDNPLFENQQPTPPDNPLTETQQPTPPDNPLIETQQPTPPDNPLTETQQPTPPDNPLFDKDIYLWTKAHCVNLWATDPSKYYDLDNKAAQPYSLCPGKEARALHLSDGKAKRIWFTLGFPRPTSRHDKPYATPSWVADFVLPQYPGTIEVDENYCLNIVLPGGPMQQCLTRSCINRPPYNGAPVKEINPYSLWNYYQDKIADPPNTCAGNKGASIPGNTGQIVGFNTGEQYLQPTFQEASFSTGSEEVGTISNNKNNNNGIVSASGTIPNVPDPALLDANSGFITIPESPFPVAAATPGDSYADSNNLPINAWTEIINDWNKKNKRAAKLARRELLQRLHGSE